MAAISTYDQVGKKEQISDIITNIAPTKTPFQSMIGSESVHNTTFQWQEDDLIAAAVNAQVEAANAPTEVFNATVLRSNWTQILAKTAKASGTTEAVSTYGRDKELAYQLSLRASELKRDLEKSYVGSAAVGAVGSSSVARVMNGYQQMIALTGTGAPVVLNGVTATAAGIAAQTGTSSAALTEAMVLSLSQTLYSNGVDPNTLMIKPTDANIVGAWGQATGRTRYVENSGSGSKTITNAITTYITPHGELKVVMNRFQKTSEALMFEADMWKKAILRNWFRTTLAVTGDATSVSITGEFSLKHRNSKASGMITGLG